MLVDPTSCASPRVFVDVADFRPGGQVAVTVSCTVSTEGLELIDPPSGGTNTATAFAAIDPLRARPRGCREGGDREPPNSRERRARAAHRISAAATQAGAAGW
jgi:hypothetical protein